MYAPQYAHVTDQTALIAAAREIGIATFVTYTDGQYFISHIPTVVRSSAGCVTIEAHVAKANPHWLAAQNPVHSAAIFHGPSAYISPEWYPTKKATGKAVPTYAYVMARATGSLRAIEDEAWLRPHLEDLTDRYEGERPNRWRVSDAPDDYVQKLIHGIVGLSLAVESLEGSWKLNQHKGEADRSGVLAGLSGEPAAGPLVDEMMKIVGRTTSPHK